jgi:hypothetical protein
MAVLAILLRLAFTAVDVLLSIPLVGDSVIDVAIHGAKLVEAEDSPSPSHAPLDTEYPPRSIELDDDGNEQHQGAEQQKQEA